MKHRKPPPNSTEPLVRYRWQHLAMFQWFTDEFGATRPPHRARREKHRVIKALGKIGLTYKPTEGITFCFLRSSAPRVGSISETIRGMDWVVPFYMGEPAWLIARLDRWKRKKNILTTCCDGDFRSITILNAILTYEIPPTPYYPPSYPL